MSLPRHRTALAVLLFAAAALALSCSSGSGANGNPTAAVTPGQTGLPSPGPGDGKESTPTSLAQARGRLSSQLQAIGANIGSVPQDIEQQILDRCQALEQFANPDTVRPICQAIQQAIATDDPGLIDGVLRSLSQLKER